MEWAQRLLEREMRVTDSALIGNLMTSVSFYANTTIYIIAGLIAALGASDKLISLTSDLPFGGSGNRELLEIKLILVLISFVFAYFKFTWSLRQFNLLVLSWTSSALLPTLLLCHNKACKNMLLTLSTLFNKLLPLQCIKSTAQC